MHHRDCVVPNFSDKEKAEMRTSESGVSNSSNEQGGQQESVWATLGYIHTVAAAGLGTATLVGLPIYSIWKNMDKSEEDPMRALWSLALMTGACAGGIVGAIVANKALKSQALKPVVKQPVYLINSV